MYARLRVVFEDRGFREERTVHRWLAPGADEAVARALEDPWLARSEPESARRYRPVPDGLRSSRLRRRWVEEVAASETATGPDGRTVLPERTDVTVLAWALVWTPG